MQDRAVGPSTAETREPDGKLRFGAFHFDPGNRVLCRDGTEIDLQPRVLSVLEYLLEHPGQLVSKQSLMDAVWTDTAVAETSLLEAIKILRRALSDDPQEPTYIQTVHRRGYRFIASVDLEDPTGGEAAGRAFERRARSLAERTVDAVAHGARFLVRWERAIAWSLVVLLAVVAAVSTAGYRRLRAITPTPQPTSRFQVALPPDYPLASTYPVGFDMSPDGARIVYSALIDGANTVLVVWDLDQPNATPIPGTETPLTANWGVFPTISPDGNWVLFLQGDLVRKVSLEGGTLETLFDLASVGLGSTRRMQFFPSWASDGYIYCTLGSRIEGYDEAIYRIPESGGNIELVAAPSGAVTGFRDAELLPDGEALIVGGYPGSGLFLVSLETGEQRRLAARGSEPSYVPTGHLVYRRAGAIRARPFDASTLELGEPEAPLRDRWPMRKFSTTGTLVTGHTLSDSGLVSVDRSGTMGPFIDSSCAGTTSVSPDGRKLALDCGDVIGVYDLDRETMLRFPPDHRQSSPIWAPDGAHIVYGSVQDGVWRISRRAGDGTGSAEHLVERDNRVVPHSFSADGRLLAFVEWDPETGEDIWVMQMEGDPEPRPLVQTEAIESGARFSPSGRWIAYHSDESGDFQVYVRPYPGPGPRVQVSNDSGGWPFWSRAGMELFYLSDSGRKMMVVDVPDEPAFEPSRPRLLFEAAPGVAYALVRNGPTVDISPDGQVFYTSAHTRKPITELTIVVNWFDELRRLAPPGR